MIGYYEDILDIITFESIKCVKSDDYYDGDDDILLSLLFTDKYYKFNGKTNLERFNNVYNLNGLVFKCHSIYMKDGKLFIDIIPNYGDELIQQNNLEILTSYISKNQSFLDFNNIKKLINLDNIITISENDLYKYEYEIVEFKKKRV